MAQVGLATIAALLNLIHMDAAQDQFRRDVPLLSLLPSKVGTGEVLSWNAKFETRTAGGAYDPGTDLDDDEIDSNSREKATLPWSYYRKGVNVADETMDIVAQTGGSINDLLGDETNDAIDNLAKSLGTDLYAGDHTASPKELAGAATAISASDDDFAGIDTGVYTGWRSAADSVATSALTLAVLREKLFRPIRNATGKNPDFVTCTGAKFDILAAKFDTLTQPVSQINGMNIDKMAGVRAISIDGVPFVEDRFCTASTLYAWSQKHARIRFIPSSVNTVTPAALQRYLKELANVNISVDEIVKRMAAQREAVMPIFFAMGKSGTSTKLGVRVTAQVEWKTRNGFAKLALTS